MKSPEQCEVLAFLRQPAAWPGSPHCVEVIETHGALIFMAGDEVLKVKRAVRLPYLDFSTLEARKRYLEREIEVNAPHAPGLYRDVVAITRDTDGRLAIGGTGEAVEWGLRMRRFPQDQLLSHVVNKTGLSPEMAVALADAVVRYHQDTRSTPAPTDPMPNVVRSLISALKQWDEPGVIAAVGEFEAAIDAALSSSAEIRRLRAQSGYIRRCHGDLHLGNIVLWKGTPMPFDAIEFDETLATIDTLYDLAFLLMDLERHQARATANVILNRYLWKTGDPMDLSALRALPLFTGVRAAIRAMVALDRARLGAGLERDVASHVVSTLELGTRLATPKPAQLIAVGGLSGTGKTTLAAALAPSIGSAPGAIHIRTDLERKWLAQVDEFARLPESSYTEDVNSAVYARVMIRARLALAAGHSVVIDGVFARPGERRAIAELAYTARVAFSGIWLEARPSVMKARVAARVHDASDATPAVVEKQLALQTGAIEWARIEASAVQEHVLDSALAHIRTPQTAMMPSI